MALDKVTVGVLADNAVTSAKIADGTVVAADIGADAVGTTELANDVVINTSGAITTTGAFTSVGIDDNASGATAITIDANEKVCIGTGTANRKLTIVGDNDEPDISLVQLHNGANNIGEIRFMSVGSDDSTYRVGATVKAIYVSHTGTSPETELTFLTRQAEGSLTRRMTIKADGKIGINDDTPSYGLDLNGSFRATEPIYLTNEGTHGSGTAGDSAIKWHDMLFMHDGGAAYLFEETSSGDRIIEFNRNGNVTVEGSFSSSDELFKKDIVDISYGLSEVLAMKPREYTVKRSGLGSIGFIAQEIETIIPEIVQGENAEIKEENKKIEYDDGTTETRTTYTAGKSLDYNAFSAILCKAIQELSAKVTALENA